MKLSEKLFVCGGKKLPVVGVVKDFHTVSLRDPIEATIMLNRIRNYRSLAIKISPINMQGTIKEIQKKVGDCFIPILFSLMNSSTSPFVSFYEDEQRTSTLLAVFTSLAIFIGCLGLFGLASFMANQKTKENWCAESDGSKCAKYCHFVFKGICNSNRYRICLSCADVLVFFPTSGLISSPTKLMLVLWFLW